MSTEKRTEKRTEKCTERNTENYWACQCPGYAAVQAKRTIACPVCGGRDGRWFGFTSEAVNAAIAEAGNAYVEALSTDQPAHVTSALYLRWWSLEHPVALWPDAPRGDAPRGDAPRGDAPRGDAPRPTGFVWREIVSFEGYETSGPWGKAYVVYHRETATWGFMVYLDDFRITRWRRAPRSCEEAQKAVETLVTRWEKGGRDV